MVVVGGMVVVGEEGGGGSWYIICHLLPLRCMPIYLDTPQML